MRLNRDDYVRVCVGFVKYGKRGFTEFEFVEETVNQEQMIVGMKWVNR